MSPTPPTSEARPIDASERLVLLDVLRGFALWGVFVSNTFFWFSGRGYMPRAQVDAARAAAPVWDVVISALVQSLVLGKFVTLFSFLFGLGFSVQMLRAEARGASITPLYARRLCAMFLIGAVHLLLIWHGDILTTYALLGFTLLLFRRRTDKTVLLCAAALILVLPLLASQGQHLLSLWRLGAEGAAQAAKAAQERTQQERALMLEALTHGSYPTVMRASARYYFLEFVRNVPLFMIPLLGRFLLGLVAGRRRLFHDAPQHLPFFRKLLGWGLGLGLPAAALGLWLQTLVRQKVIDPQATWLTLVQGPMRQVNELGLAAAYLSVLVLLFQREAWQRALRRLAPVGRMALTNYLCQSVLSILLYDSFGAGLLGKLPPLALLALTGAIFCTQIVLSHVWLARFRFGPAEWVWRSLTYGRAQPLRLTEPPLENREKPLDPDNPNK